MPFFKTTANITKDHEEHFDANWMDSDSLVLPPKTTWTYDREMQIEDVDLWEVIFEGNFGIYASYSPHAEFYMIFPFYWMKDQGHDIETFYGDNASIRCFRRAKELGIDLQLHDYYYDINTFEKLKKS